MPLVDAVVVAGGTPGPDDPLYLLTKGRPKSLLPLAGRPMVQYALDAAGGAATVRQVVLAGLTEAQAAGLTCAKPWGRVPDHGGLIGNVTAGGQWAAAQGEPPTHILVVTADVPLVQPAMLDWIVTTALTTEHDLYYSLIPQAAMEARFPGSRRTYFRLREGRFTAGDVALVRADFFTGYQPAWARIVEARKSLVQQAALIGFDTLLFAALGWLSIPFGQRRIQERLGVNGRILINPHPEIGMDVDKPRQYELIQAELERRA